MPTIKNGRLFLKISPIPCCLPVILEGITFADQTIDMLSFTNKSRALLARQQAMAYIIV